MTLAAFVATSPRNAELPSPNLGEGLGVRTPHRADSAGSYELPSPGVWRGVGVRRRAADSPPTAELRLRRRWRRWDEAGAVVHTPPIPRTPLFALLKRAAAPAHDAHT